MSGHPTCPTCRMEALRLTRDGRHCDWCKPAPGLGKPFNARNWQTIVQTLQQRVQDAIAENEKQTGRAA